MTGTGSSAFSYSVPLANRAFNVTNKALQSGTATLKLNSTAGLANGDTVNVAGVDPLLNGNVVVTGVAGGAISYADAATTTLNVTKKAIAGGTTATLTVPNNHVFAGDHITVNTGDSRFDGPFTATAGGGAAGGANATVSYTIPAVSATITNASVAGGLFTLTTASGPPIENGDTVTVSTGACSPTTARVRRRR